MHGILISFVILFSLGFTDIILMSNAVFHSVPTISSNAVSSKLLNVIFSM